MKIASPPGCGLGIFMVLPEWESVSFIAEVDAMDVPDVSVRFGCRSSMYYKVEKQTYQLNIMLEK